MDQWVDWALAPSSPRRVRRLVDVHCHENRFSVVHLNRPFASYFELHYESEAKCKVFVMKISFHSYENITNFHMKSFALSLAFIVRFSATRKWPIDKTM